MTVAVSKTQESRKVRGSEEHRGSLPQPGGEQHHSPEPIGTAFQGPHSYAGGQCMGGAISGQTLQLSQRLSLLHGGEVLKSLPALAQPPY